MQADVRRTELFETAAIPRAVMTLSVPTIISSLVMVIYNLADTYFVGRLNDPVQSAAVTLAAPVLLAFNAVNNLFGVGTSSMMSRALGRRDYDTVKRSSALGFYSALTCAVLVAVLYFTFQNPLLRLLGASDQTIEVTRQYLFWTTALGAVPAIMNVVLAYLVRSEGAALHASLGTMSGCLLNIILDPFFILPFGLGMGAAGAGLATCISNCVACCYFFILLAAKSENTFVCIHFKELRWDPAILKGICIVGIPASIQNLLNVTGMTILNNFTSAYGSDAVAAMGIAHKINQVPFYIALGLSQGIMPLNSYSFGAKNYGRMRKTIYFSMTLTAAFLTALAVFYFFGSGMLISLFIKQEAVVAYGTRFLHGMCMALPFLGVDFLSVGVFQSCGMGEKSLLFAVLRKIVLEIPALYILNRLVPLYGLAYAQFTAEVILAAVAVFVLRGIFKKLKV